MPRSFHVENAFATPVVIAHPADAAELNRALESAILERRGADAGIRRSNRGGWHSRSDLVDWGGDAIARLAGRARDLADATTRDLKDGKLPEWRVSAWANVIESGGWHMPHAHGGCFWSAIYYVRVDPGEGGELVLHDPRMPMLDMYAPALRFEGGETDRSLTLPAEAGMLVLLPAWLSHSVRPWQGEGMRISVAMNLAVPGRP